MRYKKEFTPNLPVIEAQNLERSHRNREKPLRLPGTGFYKRTAPNSPGESRPSHHQCAVHYVKKNRQGFGKDLTDHKNKMCQKQNFERARAAPPYTK